MENVNLCINSKNRDNNDSINHINISLPNGWLSSNTVEYFILDANKFYTCANRYNSTLTVLNKCQLITDTYRKVFIWYKTLYIYIISLMLFFIFNF